MSGLKLYPVGTAKVEVEKASTTLRKKVVVIMLFGFILEMYWRVWTFLRP